LVFVNDGNSTIHAYDAATGASLWERQLGAATTGSGAMYEWKGRQYLLVAASGGNANHPQRSSARLRRVCPASEVEQEPHEGRLRALRYLRNLRYLS
jgi:outer membrane protein assembly factor BamB